LLRKSETPTAEKPKRSLALLRAMMQVLREEKQHLEKRIRERDERENAIIQ
jgi:hypothetical protein